LQESLGHVITVELKTGQTYRGKLADGKYTLLFYHLEQLWGTGVGWMGRETVLKGREGGETTSRRRSREQVECLPRSHRPSSVE